MDTEKLRPTVTKSAVLTGNKNKNLNQKSGVGKRELRTTEYARGAAFLSFFFFFFLHYFTDNYFAPHSIFSFGCKPLFFVKGSLLLTRDNGTHPKHREHSHEETLLHTHCEVRSSLDL